MYLTRDHHLVVHHDPHVNRTTNGAGEVTSFTLAELQALDAGYSLSPDGQSFPYRAHHIRIPTLDEVRVERKRTHGLPRTHTYTPTQTLFSLSLCVCVFVCSLLRNLVDVTPSAP